MVLDIGCGNRKEPGVIGLDRVLGTQADVIADIEQTLPFKSDVFSTIICKGVLEHSRNLVGLMEEIWRVAQPGAVVEIGVPHFAASEAYVDPTHVGFFSIRTFDYFTGDNRYNFYSRARFETEEQYIVMKRLFRFLGVERLANLVPRFYEDNLCFLLRPKRIEFTLRVIK